jgi:diguanylate cyclase (GGDEF)-like protein
MSSAVKNWLAELERRITNRSDSTSALVLVECTLPFLILLLAMQLYAALNAELAPLYSARWLWPSLWAQALLIGWLSIMGAVAMRWKTDKRPMSWLVQLTIFPAGLGVLLLSLSFGVKDTPICTIVMAEFVFLRSLFPVRNLKYFMATALSMIVLNEWAVHQGWLTYAPLLAKPIYEGSTMSWWWVLWTRTLYLCAAYPVTGWFFFLSNTMYRNRIALKELARTDTLTGVVNRREFMSRLESQAAQQIASDSHVLSIVMFDVDHFKHVNDTHGHQAGDAVLARLGQILRDHAREHIDTAARLGGEEFVLMLPGLGAGEAQRVAERVSTALRLERFQTGEQSFSVTQSVGVAQVMGGQVFAALKEADDNLYRAKQAGRNRIVVSERRASELSDA